MDKKLMIALSLIVLLGAIVRICTLTMHPLWLDEAFAVYESQKSLTHVLTLEDPTPPLYYLLLHFWIRLFGISAFAVRMLSLVLGLASIFMTFKLASLFLKTKAALISSLLVALSPLHVYISQEVRAYPLLFLMTLVSMYYFLRWTDQHNTKNALLYVVSSVLLIYSHMYGFLILMVHNLYFFFHLKKQDTRAWLVMQSAVVLCFIPWLIQLVSILQRPYHNWIQPPDLMNFFYLFFHVIAGVVHSYAGAALCVVVLLLITRARFNQLLLYWILVPACVPFIYSLLFRPIFIEKYVFFISFPILMLAADGLSRFTWKKEYVFTVVSLLLLVTLFIQQTTPIKNRWDLAAEYIHNSSQDAIVLINSYIAMPYAYYAHEECFASDNIYSCLENNDVYPVDDLEILKGVPGETVTIVLAHEQHNPHIDQINGYLEHTFTVLESRQFESTYQSKLLMHTMKQEYRHVETITIEKLKRNG